MASNKTMKKLIKPGVVVAGYVAAFLITCAAFYIHELLAPEDQAQASAGMQAYADITLFIGAFGILSLAPTALALYFLRPFHKFWTLFSAAVLALAITGSIAAAEVPRPQAIWAMFGILAIPRILMGSPLLCFGSLISAVIAPTQRSRLILLTAAFIEGVVSAYAFFCLFVLQRWL
jgi:hypothetical protein